ncbi:phosphoribosylglycinamide formyltransferase [Novosphingobium acidiphilum]|uniref:phosphoribosylglycinamide formyltransferase n=1 Tax=Novosphingobium acidiphilum TaxID=505248 RepID=UPI00048C0E79|nr:phosphoribosylglycinamide formyltransferase [Novosphingobium acidiphilum]
MPERRPRVPVAVLLSGGGTNMAALLYASRLPDCPYDIVLVASNNPAAGGLKLAAAEGIATFALPHKGMARADHDAAMEAAVLDAGARFIAMAGYMRILGEDFVTRWRDRMVNIHPSLLPRYTGLDTHARAIAAGDSHGGCTVHLVTPELDQGPVLGQIPVAILPGDNAETLAARVLFAEHQLYARCLADLVGRARSPGWLTAQVAQRALALPQTDQAISHGMASFGVIKGKKFAYVASNHHGDGRVALLVKISGVDEQDALIERDDERFYRPAYFGDDWIAMRLDHAEPDWDEIAQWLQRSWLAIAPRRLAALIGE